MSSTIGRPPRRQVGIILEAVGDQVGLLEVDKQEVIAVQPTSSKLQWPTMAYSPTGKQFGCTANDRVLAWSAETGELIAEIPANGIPFNVGSDFPANGFFLAGHKYLLDLENKLQFWQYEGMESIGSAGGMTFAVATDGQKPSEGQGPQAGFGLGQSRFTPTGLK